jgi:hypothetical protein
VREGQKEKMQVSIPYPWLSKGKSAKEFEEV